MLDDAIAMARRLGDPRALIEALRMRVNLDPDPTNIRLRIASIAECISTGA